MNMKYEKPAMTFVNVQSEESVANICWGGNMGGQNLTWAYYGTDHKIQEPKNEDPEGWFTFKIDAGNCKQATASNVVITYQGTAADGTEDDTTLQTKLYAGFLEDVNVSNAGSPWVGEGTITPVVPTSK